MGHRVGHRRIFGSALLLPVLCGAARGQVPASQPSTLLSRLTNCPHRIVYETRRDNNFELFIMNADGSNPVNLTRTADADELYPHASPDGTRVCFIADEGKGAARSRNVYYMNLDGTGRTKIADNATQPCWNPDGTVIAYLGGVPGPYTLDQAASKELYFYDLRTGKTTEHVNKSIDRMLCLCWSPDGKWFTASAVGGLGYAHSVIAFEADGMRHCELTRGGRGDWRCRPDFSPDGKRILYAHELGEFPNNTMRIDVADMIWTPMPKISNAHPVVSVPGPMEVYHGDWSSDGRFIAGSRGPKQTNKMKPAAYIVGIEAKGWDIWVADAAGSNDWVAITHDGLSNKEPDWVFTKR